MTPEKPLSRTAEAVLLLVAMRGGVAHKKQIESDYIEAGIHGMTDEEYQEWKDNVREFVRSGLDVCRTRLDLPK